MTPALAGLLAMLSFAVGLAGVPLLRDRGPADRLGLGDDRDAGARRPFIRRLFESVAGFLGPRVLPAVRASRRESVDRRIDLAGRPGRADRAALLSATRPPGCC